MWKKKKISPIERLRKNNQFLRSHIAFGMLLIGGIIILCMALNVRKKIEGIFLDSEELGFLEAILVAQGANVIFISSCMAGAFLGAAFALKFRPTSKSEIIVELSEKVEALEQKLNEKT